MNSSDYEKESVERGLKKHDQIIGSLEEALRIAQESRREYVNRHDINKEGYYEGMANDVGAVSRALAKAIVAWGKK